MPLPSFALVMSILFLNEFPNEKLPCPQFYRRRLTFTNSSTKMVNQHSWIGPRRKNTGGLSFLVIALSSQPRDVLVLYSTATLSGVIISPYALLFLALFLFFFLKSIALLRTFIQTIQLIYSLHYGSLILFAFTLVSLSAIVSVSSTFAAT